MGEDHLYIAERFYHRAVEFCSYIENTVITMEEVDCLLEKLMLLYVDAMHLPYGDVDSVENGADKSIEDIHLRIDIPDYFQELFDPYNDQDIVGCSLTDDLFDIRYDLLGGIYEYEAGFHNNAVFCWRHSLDTHWGKHATDAMRALHCLRTR